jgi:hypothetical protein
MMGIDDDQPVFERVSDEERAAELREDDEDDQRAMDEYAAERARKVGRA